MPQTQDFNIRYLKEKDYSYIVESTRKILENILPGKAFEEEKVSFVFQLALLNESHTAIVLVDNEDNAKGFVLLGIEELYFHSTKVAICLSIWIDPSCRGHSLDMMRAVHTWAKFKKADFSIMSSFTNLSPEKFDRVLSYFKYKSKELVYWKEI